jgi:hypothetical protein
VSYAVALPCFGCSTEQSGPLARSSFLRMRTPSSTLSTVSVHGGRVPGSSLCVTTCPYKLLPRPVPPLLIYRACTEPKSPPVDAPSSSSWKYATALCLPLHSSPPGFVRRVGGLRQASAKPSVVVAGGIVHRAALNCSPWWELRRGSAPRRGRASSRH